MVAKNTPKVSREKNKSPISNGSAIVVDSVKPVEFKAETYYPTDLFSVSSTVPYCTENEFNQRFEEIKGQIRSVKLAEQNFALIEGLNRVESQAVKANNQAIQTQIYYQDGQTLHTKLQQSQIKTQIEQSKLKELSHDLKGFEQQAELKSQAWKLKLDGLQADLDQASRLLEIKKAEIALIQ